MLRSAGSHTAYWLEIPDLVDLVDRVFQEL